MQIFKRLEPLLIADTSAITEQEWLELRRQGIGGSDAAAVLGASPFMTKRDLFYTKLGVEPAEPDESSWVRFEIGHLLEDLIARIFAKKTGFPIYPVKKMYRHPVYGFILANPDYFTEDRDGPAILEIKSTSYFAKDNWWDGGKEIVPAYYVSQGRHYMAATDMHRVYYCCLYGNSFDDVIIRRIDRDRSYEEELIFHEADFWNGHVVTQIPPPYTESGDLVLESVKRYSGPADISKPEIVLDNGYLSDMETYLALQAEKSEWNRRAKIAENRMKQIKGRITDRMGKSCTASCFAGDTAYQISYKPELRPSIGKDNLLRLKLQYPDIYDEFITVSENRRFSVKPAAMEIEERMAA